MRTVAVALGDSLTYGFPYGPPASWVHHAQARSGFTWINAGENGATAQDLLVHFPSRVLAYQPTYLFIGAGTNEALRGESPTRFRNALCRLSSWAGEEHITTLVLLPPPILGPEEKQLAVLRQIIQQESPGTVDFYHPLLDANTRQPDPRWYSDDVHLNRAGYRRLAEALDLTSLTAGTAAAGPAPGRRPAGNPGPPWSNQR